MLQKYCTGRSVCRESQAMQQRQPRVAVLSEPGNMASNTDGGTVCNHFEGCTIETQRGWLTELKSPAAHFCRLAVPATVWTGLALLRTQRRSAPGLFPHLWWFAGNLWHSLAGGSVSLTSAFMFQCLRVCVCPQISPFKQLLAKLC